MVKVVFILMTAPLLLVSCTSTQPRPILTPVEVKVPVATPVYCSVAKLDKPALPLSALKADSAPADTMRAYAATVAVLKGAVRERDSMLAGCAAPESVPAAPSPDATSADKAAESTK